jgi:glyoxylase-like metal-dependent hydrolase (beta-lactamase superfamily II)
VDHKNKQEILAESNDMTPVQGVVDVDIPIDTLWDFFTHANWWPRWNKCFFWANNRSLVLAKQLVWAFQPIRRWYLYKMFAIAKIVEVESQGQQRKVTWEVKALPGFYARHTYHMEDLGNGKVRFGSWEKATGWGFRLMKRFWITHFTFVKDRSLEGAIALDAQYANTGKLDEADLPRKSYMGFWVTVIGMILVLAALIVGGWFYFSYVHLTSVELAPGIHAVFGGGGNALVVQEGQDALLVDTKFPPGSNWLRDWISRNVSVPVTKVVNTHYHYDHTQGNTLYPAARKIAQAATPELMRKNDSDWWDKHEAAIPTETVQDRLALSVGGDQIVLTHPNEPAHTAGDLWVFVRQFNIIATGDIVFNGYYPFMDQPEGGTSIAGMIKAIRGLADDHPNATFLPGHGPLATANDLRRYADYLEFLYDAVGQAHQNGWSEDEAAKRVNLSRWKLSILPSFHHKRLIWATAENNIRWAYRLWRNTQVSESDCGTSEPKPRQFRHVERVSPYERFEFNCVAQTRQD